MRINKLEELRNIHHEIKNRDGNDVKSKERMILESVQKMIELNNIARREGLLALEEAVENGVEEELKQLIILLVDGTEPDVMQGIGMARYYSGLYVGYQALKYFIYLEGALSIQAGDNPWILEEKLKSMLPARMYLSYSLEQEKKVLEEQRKKKENLIEDLCKGKRLWNPGENGYYVSKLADYVICDSTDKELQRLMREVDNTCLALAMKGMSGEARKHIFKNLSERLGKTVAEDMASMGPVRAADILEASQKLLTIFIRLIEQGEICGKYEYLEPFFDVFHVDIESKKQKSSKLVKLKSLVEEYEQSELLVKEMVGSDVDGKEISE